MSSTGTEYVNAKLEDIKDIIDNDAKKIAGMSPGATIGMVYFGLFQTGDGVISVYIVGDESNGRNRYNLIVRGGINGGSGINKSIDTGIPEAARPQENVTIKTRAAWRDSDQGVEITVSLSKKGRLNISVPSNTSGMANANKYYYNE